VQSSSFHNRQNRTISLCWSTLTSGGGSIFQELRRQVFRRHGHKRCFFFGVVTVGSGHAMTLCGTEDFAKDFFYIHILSIMTITMFIDWLKIICLLNIGYLAVFLPL
jgi:hypothetical protein